MRRLGAVLFLLAGLLMANQMDVRPVWSGGSQWTPENNARLDGEWMDNGETPVTAGLTGVPVPDVAIGGTHRTDVLMAASWSLGISDFLADLSPNTASFSFVGQVTATQGDDVVVSTGWGVNWVGRVDTVTQARDTAGDWWTTITATDRIGALGAAVLADYTLGAETVESGAEKWAAAAGIALDIVDDSVAGLALIAPTSGTYSGSVLQLVNSLARRSNAMLALQRDGAVHAVIREAVTPSSVLTLTGINGTASWSLSYSIEVDINRWAYSGDVAWAEDAGDIDRYGQRTYDVSAEWAGSAADEFLDWTTYGGSQRPTATAELIVSEWSQDDLILLDPFQWVTESGTAWQVMSVQHTVSSSPRSWTVTVTLDNLLDLL